MACLNIWLGTIWIAGVVESARLAQREAPGPPEESAPLPQEGLNLPQQCVAQFPHLRQGRLPANGQVPDLGELILGAPKPNWKFYASQVNDLDLSRADKGKLRHELKAFDDGVRTSTGVNPPFDLFEPEHYEVCLDSFKEGFEMVSQLGLSPADVKIFMFGYDSEMLKWLFERDARAEPNPARTQGIELAQRDMQRYGHDPTIMSARSTCFGQGIDSATHAPKSSWALRGRLNGIAVGGCVKELIGKSRNRRPDLTQVEVLCEQYLTCIEWWRNHLRNNQKFSEGERPVQGEGLGRARRMRVPDPPTNMIEDTVQSGKQLYVAASNNIKQIIKSPPKSSSLMPKGNFLKIPSNVRVPGGGPMIKTFARR
ncbi:MAG: hypothetical protein M1823_005229 [Watsoniomyces obsoletus]|nr:MAG: hypothetical protein M1823_005229 [Watsoniomyces obsoletus]